MIRFSKTYFVITLLLLLIEVLIALYIHDQFIRPYVGDFLVVILMYCFVKSFYPGKTLITAAGVLLFSYLIETLQYFNIVQLLGLADSKVANTIIGNYFTWIDILAYTLGIVFVVLAERWQNKRLQSELHQFI
jgi:hypothetical protein